MIRFANTSGGLYNSASSCYIYQSNGYLILGTDVANADVMIGSTNGHVELDSSDQIILNGALSGIISASSCTAMVMPRHNGLAGGVDGKLIFDTSDHKLWCYSLADSAWHALW